MKLCPSVTLSSIGVLVAIASWAVAAAPPLGSQTPWPPVATFLILGYDPETGEIGGAVQSRVFAVGNGVLWAEADTGIVATQAIVAGSKTTRSASPADNCAGAADTRLGPGSSMEVATRVRATR